MKSASLALAGALLLGGCERSRQPPPAAPVESVLPHESIAGPAPAVSDHVQRTPIRPVELVRPPDADTPPTPGATGAELGALRAGLVVPVQGVARSALRDSYTEARGGRVHQAIDIMAPRGTPVLSAADGRLLRLHPSAAGGNMVYAADASDHFILMYSHLDRYAPGLAEGMPLRRGQLLGWVGSSGNADPANPHLHFAIARGDPRSKWWLGTPVNPYPLLAP